MYISLKAYDSEKQLREDIDKGKIDFASLKNFSYFLVKRKHNAEYPDVKQSKPQGFSTLAGGCSIDWPGDVSVNIEGGRTGKAIISWNDATISDGSTPYYNVIVQGQVFCNRVTNNSCTLDWNRWMYHQVYVYAYKLGDEKNAKVKAKAV